MTFGCGNAPDGIIPVLKKATSARKHKILIVNTTQCLKGAVSANYATGKVSS